MIISQDFVGNSISCNGINQYVDTYGIGPLDVITYFHNYIIYSVSAYCLPDSERRFGDLGKVVRLRMISFDIWIPTCCDYVWRLSSTLWLKIWQGAIRLSVLELRKAGVRIWPHSIADQRVPFALIETDSYHIFSELIFVSVRSGYDGNCCRSYIVEQWKCLITSPGSLRDAISRSLTGSYILLLRWCTRLISHAELLRH